MQFKKNTPDIPDELVKAHEKGRVVFFCGAGISYPAGLPGFKELVDAIYEKIGTEKNELEKKACEKNQFDTVLHLLEDRLPGEREAVREAVFEILKPDLNRKGAVDTHQALLKLGRCEDGLRLVTTNFDRLFEHARDTGKPFRSYEAPRLPICKKTRWNGVVYLHGLLPDQTDRAALDQLVLTSGDFGLAYLTEGWAARFVCELLHRYTVCFVGYSISDPILRYILDALAADRMMEEPTSMAYAFGAFDEGDDEARNEWTAKGVIPVPYSSKDDHRLLHETLKAWASVCLDRTGTKKRMIADNAHSLPVNSTQQDRFVERMKWALSDSSEEPARYFAELNPPPPIEWLEAFSDDGFGVMPPEKKDEKGNGLSHRPEPYTFASRMALLSGGDQESRWDHTLHQIARWLTRHLNEPRLIFFFAEKGGQLHSRLRVFINEMLYGSRKNASNEILPPMRILWRLLLTGRMASPHIKIDLSCWIDHLKQDGVTASLRLKLRELLAPKILLQGLSRKRIRNKTNDNPKCISDIVHWEMTPTTRQNIRRFLPNGSEEWWQKALPSLLEDFQQLLLDALDLQNELDETNKRDEQSHRVLPSVSPHPKNRMSSGVGVLIELVRDAYIALRKENAKRAAQIAESWFEMRYLTFKRLALFAASEHNVIDPDTWVEWLIATENTLLWSDNTQRETLRLLVLQGSKLTCDGKQKLETAILKGPPNQKQEDRDKTEYSIWLRLAKLQSYGVDIGPEAKKRMGDLQKSHPEFKLKTDESDEFFFNPDDEDHQKKSNVPLKWEELVGWLKEPPPRKHYGTDNWCETCRIRFCPSIDALCHLSQDNVWPVQRWKEALRTWSEKALIQESWHSVAPVLKRMPDETLREMIEQVSAWVVEASAKAVGGHETILIELCDRILKLMPQEEARNTKNLFREAINHPIGHAAEALLKEFFNRRLKNGEKLPDDVGLRFTELCDKRKTAYRYARTLLASRLMSLFLVDPEWTEKNLLPYFSWDDPVEANAVWHGFLGSPRRSPALLSALKSPFLETSAQYEKLGDFAEQYAGLLTRCALSEIDDFTKDDFKGAFESLPVEGLEYVAMVLVNELKDAGTPKGAAYWEERIKPFFQNCWPKSKDKKSESISESFSELCVHAGDQFPSALETLKHWLQPVDLTDSIIGPLSGICQNHPRETFDFLKRIMKDPPFLQDGLKACFDAISEKSPELSEDPLFKKLIDDAG